MRLDALASSAEAAYGMNVLAPGSRTEALVSRGSAVGGDRARSPSLLDRHDELARLTAVIDHEAEGGAACLVIGEAGIGKTALLDAVARLAAVRGHRVLRATGAKTRPGRGSATLRHLLAEVMADIDHLDAFHRDALHVAVGMAPGPVPPRLTLLSAVMELLRRISCAAPVTLIIDDVQWVDEPTATLLGSLARRLGGTRIAFIAAGRDAGDALGRAALPTHHLGPLSNAALRTLVTDKAARIAPAVRRRLVADARGNPWAAQELVAALSESQRAGQRALPGVVAVDGRARRLLAPALDRLESRARAALLIAALEATGDLRIVEAIVGTDALAILADAERLGVVTVAEDRIGFVHPLTASVVVGLASAAERQAASRELAHALRSSLDRHARHLVAVSPGPDDWVAALAELSAERLLRSGEVTAALTAFLRAAERSAGPSRARRLGAAAHVAASITGDRSTAPGLLAEALRADAGPARSLEEAVAAGSLLLSEGDAREALRLLLDAFDAHGVERPHGRIVSDGVHVLLGAARAMGADDETWARVDRVLGRLGDRAGPEVRLRRALNVDPAGARPADLADLNQELSGLHDEADPVRIVRLATAALSVDRASACHPALWRVIEDGREDGVVAAAITALTIVSLDDVASGSWDDADRCALEALALCDRTGHGTPRVPLMFVRALVAANRGLVGETEDLTDRIARWSLPRGLQGHAVYVHRVRASLALAREDDERAFAELSALSAPGTLAPRVPLALWSAGDLVEAAMRTGRRSAAKKHLDILHEKDRTTIAPRLEFIGAVATAVAARSDDEATAGLSAALERPGVDRWPFETARARLALGEALGRRGQPRAARPPLMAAAEGFAALGAGPWHGRARRTLALADTGSSGPRGALGLTDQELEIARLAASGLTNKEIGARLFLSHRTVGAHLYRIYPKLGIDGRGALAEVLPPSTDLA